MRIVSVIAVVDLQGKVEVYTEKDIPRSIDFVEFF